MARGWWDGWRTTDAERADPLRARKYRQAAFVYLHLAILYEAAVFAMWREGLLPLERGPAWLWLLAGAAIALLIFWAILRWQNRWFVRLVWLLQALRLPALISGAFFATEPEVATEALSPAFYFTALVVVLIGMGFLARAGWDL